MDGCTNVFNLDNASALKDLQKDYGSNIDGFSSALTKLVNNVKDGGFEPTKEFSKYVKTHYNREDINFNSKEEYIRKEWDFKGAITTDYIGYQPYCDSLIRCGGNLGMGCKLGTIDGVSYTTSSSNRIQNRFT